MTRIVRFLTILLFLKPFCLGQTPPNTTNQRSTSSNPAISIALEGPAHPVRLDSPMTVNITMTNITDKDIFWEWYRGKDAEYKAFGFSLMKDGREVETTFFHRKISGRQRPEDPPEVLAGSFMPASYRPGKMFAVTIDLKRLYDIKEPGQYTLDVSAFDTYSKTKVRSKSVTLEILPQ